MNETSKPTPIESTVRVELEIRTEFEGDPIDDWYCEVGATAEDVIAALKKEVRGIRRDVVHETGIDLDEPDIFIHVDTTWSDGTTTTTRAEWTDASEWRERREPEATS